MKMTRYAVLLVQATVTVLLAQATWCGRAVAAEKKFQKSFSAGSGAMLSLETHSGTVKVVGGDSGDILVEAVVEGREKDVRDFDISADQSGNEVSVRGVLTDKDTWIWYSPRLSVTFTIHVPRECGLKLNTTEGSIRVGGVRGVLKGGASTGDITIAGTEGNVNLQTRSGSVHADSCRGTFNLSTSGGGVYITHVEGDVDASSSAGDIRIVDVSGAIRAQTEGGDMTLRLAGPNRGIHAESSGGDIRITLPRQDAGDIDAEASGGEVMCTFPGSLRGTVHRDEIDARWNGGGNPIYAHTAGGDVRLVPSE